MPAVEGMLYNPGIGTLIRDNNIRQIPGARVGLLRKPLPQRFPGGRANSQILDPELSFSYHSRTDVTDVDGTKAKLKGG